MAKDKRVEGVVERWGPRFLANGVPPTDMNEALKKIETWDAWCHVWSARAKLHEAMGRAALEKHQDISAGEHLQTAGVLYHFAKFVFVNDMAQLKAAHAKAVDCRTLALPYLDPPGERVAIPYEGNTLYGILRKPKGVAKPPVVIMCMGMDSAKEEMATNEYHFLRRGIATLAFDGPGQGEAEYDMPIRPDYETVVSAVCDFVETRADLDPARIAVWGVSFGGYYAPRAAAFEKRLKACIAISGPFDFGRLVGASVTNEVFTVRAHAKSQDEALATARRVSLAGLADRIICPMYIVGGEHDTICPPEDQERLAREAGGETVLAIIPGGNHCANNLRHCYSPQSADWLADILGGQLR
jgi:alpha-beta hydrolase superfamily lysophospholipase